MAVATAPGARRSLLGQLLAAVAAAAPRLRRLLVPAAAAAREYMTDVAAFTAINYGAFTAWHHGGWIVLGVSAFLLDLKIRG